jgi:hypothetical protein
LFRQYFPAGGVLGAQTNGEEDQPRLAGIDEGKTEQPENVPVAVETTAEVPSEAKAMGEVVPAPATEETKAELAPEVAGHTDAPAPASEPAPTTSAATQTVAASELKPKEETILTFPAPLKEGEGEEPRGLWGGFWRRRTDD